VEEVMSREGGGKKDGEAKQNDCKQQSAQDTRISPTAACNIHGVETAQLSNTMTTAHYGYLSVQQHAHNPLMVERRCLGESSPAGPSINWGGMKREDENKEAATRTYMPARYDKSGTEVATPAT
jgi:hypothetical protein